LSTLKLEDSLRRHLSNIVPASKGIDSTLNCADG
jgi:hypothetical protein